jgi:ferredoxin
MRIIADPARCAGAGQCVLTDPALFDQSQEDGTVIVVTPRPGAAHQDRARQAVRLCPSGAITIAEEQDCEPPASEAADVDGQVRRAEPADGG